MTNAYIPPRRIGGYLHDKSAKNIYTYTHIHIHRTTEVDKKSKESNGFDNEK